MMNDTDMITGAPISGSPSRKRDDGDRCIEALQAANARGACNLDVPRLRRLLEFPKEEFDIVARHIFAAINACVLGEQPDAPPRYVDCPNCNHPLTAPAPEIQIERLREFQLGKPMYWQWSPRELKLLMEHLKPGEVIIPKYAHNCDIRQPNGRIVEYK